MKRRQFFSLFVISLVTFVSAIQAQNAYKLAKTHPTGMIPPSEATKKFLAEHARRVTDVPLSEMGRARINTYNAKFNAASVPPSSVGTATGNVVTSSLSAQGPLAAQSIVIPAMPRVVDNSKERYFPPIGDQRGQGSCCSFSTTYYLLTYTLNKARGVTASGGDPAVIYSPKWTYNIINNGGDNGSGAEDALHLFMTNGCATLADVPYNGLVTPATDYLEWSTDPQVWRRALNNRVKYINVVDKLDTDVGLQNLKKVLLNGDIVTFGTGVYSWVYKAISDDPSTTNDNSEVGKDCCFLTDGIDGGHQMAIVGYNDDIWVDVNGNGVVDAGEKGAFRIANSWGTGFSDKGFTWLLYDAIRAISQVPNPPAYTRVSAIASQQALFVAADASYAPIATAEFTLAQTQRNDIVAYVGISDINQTSPVDTFQTVALNSAGGGYNFNGTTGAASGSFVLDLTDICTVLRVDNLTQKKFYLRVIDRYTGEPTTVNAFKIVEPNASNGPVYSNLPQSVDFGLLSLGLNYQLANRYNYPPSVEAGPNIFQDVMTPSVTLSGTVTDDNLPAGSAVTTQWVQMSGPTTASIASPASLTTTVGVPAYGKYCFGLTASDGQKSATDFTYVNVMRGILFAGSSAAILIGGDASYPVARISGSIAAMVYRANDREAIRLFDVSNPLSPSVLSTIDAGVWGTYFSLYNGYLYVATYDNPSYHLRTYDVTNPASPVLTGDITPYLMQNIYAANGYLYAGINGSSNMALATYSLSNPRLPTFTGSCAVPPGGFCEMTAWGKYIVKDNGYELDFIDVSNPAAPSVAKTITFSGGISSFLLDGNMLYCAENFGLTCMDLSNLNNPVTVGRWESGVQMDLQVAKVDGRIWLSQGYFIYVMDVSSPSSIKKLETFTNEGVAYKNICACQTSAVVFQLTPDVTSSIQLSTFRYVQAPKYTVTAAATGNGSASLDNADGIYGIGDVAKATATPGSGGSFANWTGDISTTDNPARFVVTSNTSIVANFSGGTGLTKVPVVTSSASSALQASTLAHDGNVGTRWESAVGVDPQWIVYDLGSAQAISAVVFDWEAANAKNYTLEGSNDATFATKTVLSTKTNMASGDHRIDSLTGLTGSYRYYRMYGTARNLTYGYSIWETRFYKGGGTPTTYALVTSANPAAGGTVSGAGTYNAGTNVSVTATPATGYTFTGWSGDASGSANPTTVTMSAGRSVTANFALQTFTVTPSAGANGSISPATAQTVTYGGSVTFTFTPAAGYVLDAVKVDGAAVTPTGSTYTIAGVTAAHTISVTFKQGGGTLVPQTVSASTASSGTPIFAYDGNTGTRWESTQGVDPQWIVYDLGSAKAISVMVFDWETASAKNYTLEGSNDATFATKTTLATETNMTSSQHRIDSLTGLTGSYRYYRMYGTARSTGWGYSIWETRFYTSGGTTNYSLSTSTTGSGSGTISLSPAGGSYAAGTLVTLTAAPAASSTFGAWGGDLSGSTNPTTIVMNGSHSVSASFAIRTYTMTASAGANGSISPASQTVNYGTSVTYTITPSSGYVIDQVTVDAAPVANPTSTYTFSNITANHTISATFKASGVTKLPISAATASSNLGGNVAANVKDGNMNTRWESTQGVDPQWIYVDLGSAKNLSEVKLFWEAANAKNYTLEASNDATFATKTVLATKTNMASGTRTDDHTGLSGSYRYVRMNGTARNLGYGYSIWEFEVYGN